MARTSLYSNRFARILHALFFLFKFSFCSSEFSTLWKEDLLFYFNMLPDIGSLWGIHFGDSFLVLMFFSPLRKCISFNGRMSYFLPCKQTLALNYCLVQQIAAIHRFKIRFKSKTLRYLSCKTLTVLLDLNHCLAGLDSKSMIFVRGGFISV